jgi:hypothetical protein
MDTSFKPKALFTVLSSGIDSFHFHVAGSTFETTFSPDAMVQDLWGIWFADLSKMHLHVAVAWIVWACGFNKPELPCFCAGRPSAAYPA